MYIDTLLTFRNPVREQIRGNSGRILPLLTALILASPGVEASVMAMASVMPRISCRLTRQAPAARWWL